MKVLFTEKNSKRHTFVSYAVSSAFFALLGGIAAQIFTGNALAQIPFAQGTIPQNTAMQNTAVQNNIGQINWQSGINEALAPAKTHHKLIIIHFYGKNCPPCKAMDADVYTDPRVIAGLNQQFIPVKIDTGAHPELVKQFDIKAIPTNIVIDENGKIIDKRQGGISADRFCQYLGYLQAAAGRIAVPQTAAPIQHTVPANQLVLNDPFPQQAVPQVQVQQVSPPAVQPQVVQNPVQMQPLAQQSAEVAKSPAVSPNPMRSTEISAPPAAMSVAAVPVPAAGSPLPPDVPSVILPENCETVKPSMIELPLALDGYCPVVLTNEERWAQGNPQFYAMFQGLIYHLSSEKTMQAFVENPLKYAPAMKGGDVVLLAERSRQNLGSRKFGAWFEGRVYLFSCQETLNIFAAKPEHYAAFAKQQETAQHTSLNTVQR